MTPWKIPPSLPSPAPTVTVLSCLRASTWLPVALRIVAVAVALVVLAWVGRSAAAGPTTAGLAAADARDAAAAAPANEAPTATPAANDPAAVLAGPAPAPAPAPTTRGHASSTDPVYLNHATVEELRRLPGVGPKRAEAILVLRQRLGRFQRVEDLLRVKGVGRGAVKKWRPLVRLDTPAAADATGDGGLR